MSEIYIDISKPYPTSEEVFSHELNKNSSKHLTVAFYEENEPFDLTSYGVTATFVCNGYLVAEDVGVTNKHDNVFTLDISSTNSYTILPGLMLIEFKITSGAAELYSVTAMQVKVVPSIRDNAQVTPESYGTVSEILQEVAEARGIFNNIDGRFDDIEVNVESVTQTANNLDTEVTNARGTYTNVDARFDADEAQINGILPIDYSKLRSDLQQVISSKQKHLEATVSNLDDSTFKSYIDAKTLYFLKFTGSAATALGSRGSGIMTVIPGSGTSIKREIVFPTSTNEKYVQNVTLGTPNTYSAWNKVQTIDLNTVPKITVWDYSTSETNNFTVPTSFEGKLGDIVVITTGSGLGGKKFELVKTVTNSGITSYYWEENVTFDNVTTKGQDAVVNVDGTLSRIFTPNVSNGLNLFIPGGISIIYNGCFKSDPRIKIVYIPVTLQAIHAEAFMGCRALTQIVFFDRDYSQLTTIGASAFNNCQNLESVVLPDRVTDGGNYAFANTGITSFTFGSGITSIAQYMFEQCYNLPSIIIPNNIRFISRGAFAYCTSLTTVDLTSYIDANSIPDLLDISAFGGTPRDRKFIVANSTMKEAFSSATNWSFYADDIEIAS